jgi:hypothetical protein
VRSLGDIRERSRIAARKAAQESLRPYIVEADDLADLHLALRAGVVPTLSFPILGDHQPPCFEPTENRYFVDSSFDPVGGLTLTIHAFREPLRFVKYLREGYAYAFIKAGQSYVQEYVPMRTTEATEKHAMTNSPLLAKVTAALQREEEMREEVTELFGCLEDLQQRLARRMALLQEAEEHLRRGDDLTVAARDIVERIAAADNRTFMPSAFDLNLSFRPRPQDVLH